MGRTTRKRKRKKKNKAYDNHDNILNFFQWLLSKSWKPVQKLKVYQFPQTGRGMMACEKISCDSILVRIPDYLLITIKSVSQSLLGDIIKNCGETFSTQEVLAVFLAWQRHLGKDSLWYWYISTLPKTYSSPLFLDQLDVEILPDFVKDKIIQMKDDVKKSYELINKILLGKLCDHCKLDLSHLITEEIYFWAWFTVNSRSIYMDPKINLDNDIKLCDNNSMALAPYLDMFNHSNNAKVEASFNLENNCYEVKTLVSYNKNEQVFFHYGDHNNLKLYLEYGFILNNNVNDLIYFNENDFNCIYTNKNDYNKKLNYLILNNFFCNLYCSSEGLAWNVFIVCFMFTSCFEFNSDFNKKLYSGSFTAFEWHNIYKLCQLLLKNKLLEFEKSLLNIENVKNNEILKIACNLLKEYINILKICKAQIDEKCN